MAKKIVMFISVLMMLSSFQACKNTSPSTPAASTPGMTFTVTVTSSRTATYTRTPSATYTRTITPTFTMTPSFTATRTSTPAHSPTATATYTFNPLLTSLSPDTGTFNTGDIVPITIYINQPSPAGGTQIALNTTGGCASVAPIALIAGGMSSCTINMTVGVVPCSGGLVATLSTSTVTGSYDVVAP